MTQDDVAVQLTFIRERLMEQCPDSVKQWYIDDFVIDVDAEVFWCELERALRKWHARSH